MSAVTAAAGRRARVFVMGSCVSRDTLEYLSPQAFLLSEYVARQSLISAFGPVAKPLFDLATLESPFQRRMLTWDATSAMPRLLRERAEQVDMVLWDIFDERLGVTMPPDGGVLTISVELRRARAHGNAKDQVAGLEFGSAAHFERFAEALVAWRDLLDELHLRDRTLLLAPPWATRTIEGSRVPASFGLEADEANRLTHRYLRHIRDLVGVQTVEIEGQALADPDHKWGLAPFHYDAPTYRTLARGIAAQAVSWGLIAGPGTDDPSLVHDPSSGDRGDGRASVRTTPRVALSRTGDRELLVEVFGGLRRPCSFGLFLGADRVASTPYVRAASHRFTIRTPGAYRARVFILSPEGDRSPVSSRTVVVD